MNDVASSRPVQPGHRQWSTLAAVVCLILLLMTAGCGADQPDQLLETARFEERQNNLSHAKELYEQIIRQYPASPAADQARARLADMKPSP